jgi:hypothetical protein
VWTEVLAEVVAAETPDGGCGAATSSALSKLSSVLQRSSPPRRIGVCPDGVLVAKAAQTEPG